MKKLLLIALLPLSVNAGNYYDSDDCCTTATSDSLAYATADVNLTVNPTETVNNTYYVRTYDDDKIDAMAAQFSAIANIPGLNHRSGGHAHTGIGVGIGMAGDEPAGAIGLIHHFEENIVVKVSGAFSKEYRNTYGVGASLSW